MHKDRYYFSLCVGVKLCFYTILVTSCKRLCCVCTISICGVVFPLIHHCFVFIVTFKNHIISKKVFKCLFVLVMSKSIPLNNGKVHKRGSPTL